MINLRFVHYPISGRLTDINKSIVTSYSSYIVEDTSTLLESVAVAQDEDETELRSVVLKALQKAFQHDQDGTYALDVVSLMLTNYRVLASPVPLRGRHEATSKAADYCFSRPSDRRCDTCHYRASSSLIVID